MKWKNIATNMIIFEPTLNARQIFDRLKDLDIKDKPTHINTVQKWKQYIKPYLQSILDSGLEKLWTVATLEKHPISPEAVKQIFNMRAYHGELELTIREAKWFDRICLIQVNDIAKLRYCFMLAVAERRAILEGTDFDLIDVDYIQEDINNRIIDNEKMRD